MQKNTGLWIIGFLVWSYPAFSQKTDSTKQLFHLNGAVTLTNKGISLIPTFTLGKPAAIFDLSMGKKRIFFEPQLRFALEGKPWSFIFWWRYRVVNTSSFKMSIGAHPSLVFKTVKSQVNGAPADVIQANRYLAAELSPNYFVAKNISVGVYYLYSHGIDRDAVRNTNFITLNSNFSHISFGKKVYAKFNPQVYYLKQDSHDGFYLTASFTLGMNKFPLSAQYLFNQSIRSNIPGSRNFISNISLTYAFNNSYVRH